MDVNLGESVRDRAVLVGGKVAGVSCPDCGSETREVDVDAHSLSSVTCPDCGATVLTEDQVARLRRAHKL